MKGGLLSASNVALASPGGSEAFFTLILSNQDGSNSQQSFLSITPSGGSNTNLVSPTLAASEILVVTGVCLDPGDQLLGKATNANKIAYALVPSPPTPFRIFAHTIDGALKTHAA